MTTEEQDFQTFRRLTAARALELEQTVDDAYHPRYWVLRTRQSLEAFVREFPTATERRAAIEEVHQLRAMRAAISAELRESFEGFCGGQAATDVA